MVLARLVDRLPAVLIDTLRDQWSGLTELDKRISEIERRLGQWMKQNDAVKAIAEIPGVGLLTATAAVATLGDANTFRSGREFAAWIGLVPRQTGSGGKVALLGISKRGDTYLRTLLVHGARSVLRLQKDPQSWTEKAARQAASQCRDRCAGEQDRPHDLGDPRARHEVRTRAHQHAARIGHSAAVESSAAQTLKGCVGN